MDGHPLFVDKKRDIFPTSTRILCFMLLFLFPACKEMTRSPENSNALEPTNKVDISKKFKKGMTVNQVFKILGKKYRLESSSIDYEDKPTESQKSNDEAYMFYAKEEKLFFIFNCYRCLIRIENDNGKVVVSCVSWKWTSDLPI